jgi:hypothetical protein
MCARIECAEGSVQFCCCVLAGIRSGSKSTKLRNYIVLQTAVDLGLKPTESNETSEFGIGLGIDPKNRLEPTVGLKTSIEPD